MSCKGTCYDNAVMESFFHRLRAERSGPEHNRTRRQARASVFEYIDLDYDRQRLHSMVDDCSPEEFEALRVAS